MLNKVLMTLTCFMVLLLFGVSIAAQAQEGEEPSPVAIDISALAEQYNGQLGISSPQTYLLILPVGEINEIYNGQCIEITQTTCHMLLTESFKLHDFLFKVFRNRNIVGGCPDNEETTWAGCEFNDMINIVTVTPTPNTDNPVQLSYGENTIETGVYFSIPSSEVIFVYSDENCSNVILMEYQSLYIEPLIPFTFDGIADSGFLTVTNTENSEEGKCLVSLTIATTLPPTPGSASNPIPLSFGPNLIIRGTFFTLPGYDEVFTYVGECDELTLTQLGENNRTSNDFTPEGSEAAAMITSIESRMTGEHCDISVVVSN